MHFAPGMGWFGGHMTGPLLELCALLLAAPPMPVLLLAAPPMPVLLLAAPPMPVLLLPLLDALDCPAPPLPLGKRPPPPPLPEPPQPEDALRPTKPSASPAQTMVGLSILPP